MLAATAWCPTCMRVDTAWASGPGGRPGAACRSCGALERHRLATLLLDALHDLLREGLVVQAAPTPTLRRLLIDRVGRAQYVGFDLGLDARQVDLYGDVTEMPFADRSIRTLVCFHVLEHVPDDRRAMRELARTVADDGVVLVNNPWRRRGRTDEDPDASVEERVRRFGQADHVRWYGEDFEDRLREAGFHVHRVEAQESLPLRLVTTANLAPTPIWLLTRAGPAGEGVRARIRRLLDGIGRTPSLRAVGVPAVAVVGHDVAATRRLADAISASGVATVADECGLLAAWARAVEELRRTSGPARQVVLGQLATVDVAARRALVAEDAPAWGEVLAGGAEERRLATVRTLLGWAPRLRVVHVRADDAEVDAFDDLRLRSGPGRVVRVAPDTDPDLLADRLVTPPLAPAG